MPAAHPHLPAPPTAPPPPAQSIREYLEHINSAEGLGPQAAAVIIGIQLAGWGASKVAAARAPAALLMSHVHKAKHQLEGRERMTAALADLVRGGRGRAGAGETGRALFLMLWHEQGTACPHRLTGLPPPLPRAPAGGAAAGCGGQRGLAAVGRA
jgi:hypothetical protein